MVSEEKKFEIINSMNPDFELLSEYIGIRKDITRRCKKCGDVRTVKARSLVEKDKNGNFRMCPVCAANERAKSLRKDNDTFLEEFRSVHNDIELLDEYITNDTKIRCRCKIDGYEWSTKPHSLLEGHGCPECSHRKQNWYDVEGFNKKMKIKYPTITPLGIFTRTKDKIRFRCNDCNYEWDTEPNVLLNNDEYYGCPKCNGFAPVSEAEMVERLSKVNSRVTYISGYHGIVKSAKFKCADCGNEWDTRVTSVLSGNGCPKCNMSHGEIAIGNFLDKIGVKYRSQYTFNECKHSRVLPFDFYIKSKNIAIEYQGEQHYKPVDFAGKGKQWAIANYEQVKIRDKIKYDYCNDNKIKLIEIPYTDFDNIEEILNKYLA